MRGLASWGGRHLHLQRAVGHVSCSRMILSQHPFAWLPHDSMFTKLRKEDKLKSKHHCLVRRS
jgi:hypothetical protein